MNLFSYLVKKCLRTTKDNQNIPDISLNYCTFVKLNS